MSEGEKATCRRCGATFYAPAGHDPLHHHYDDEGEPSPRSCPHAFDWPDGLTNGDNEPEVDEYDPGPEVDDEGGMSEHRLTAADLFPRSTFDRTRYE